MGDEEKCPTCDGTGQVWSQYNHMDFYDPCPRCKGGPDPNEVPEDTSEPPAAVPSSTHSAPRPHVEYPTTPESWEALRKAQEADDSARKLVQGTLLIVLVLLVGLILLFCS